MNLNEKQIKNILAESVRTSIQEAIIKEQIKQFVRESLENLGGYSQYESSDEEDGRLSDMNTETDNEAETRDSIENFFKQPGVNNAPYAYKLYGVEAKEGQDTNDMKNARKKFADCVNHEKNENGYPYSFDSDELNTLKGMISGNQLDEAINKAFKDVLNEWHDPYFEELIEKLKKDRKIIIPQNRVYPFREYAARKGIFPEGGGVVNHINGDRVLYI